MLRNGVNEFFGIVESVFSVLTLITEFCDVVTCFDNFSRKAVTLYYACIILAVCSGHDSLCKFAQIRNRTHFVKFAFKFERVANGHGVDRLAFVLKLFHHLENQSVLRKIKVLRFESRDNDVRGFVVNEDRTQNGRFRVDVVGHAPCHSFVFVFCHFAPLTARVAIIEINTTPNAQAAKTAYQFAEFAERISSVKTSF